VAREAIGKRPLASEVLERLDAVARDIHAIGDVVFG
jgi:hypothetical protein